MELGVDKLRTRLALVEADTPCDPVKFRDLYIFSFAYAKNPSQNGIEIDMAVPYWHILLHGRFTLLELWTQFIQVGRKTEILYLADFTSSSHVFYDSISGPNYNDYDSWIWTVRNQ
jgi:hypothetical protein